MKVLITTSDGQGQRDSDFVFTKEGELAYLGAICDRDRKKPGFLMRLIGARALDPDGGCGCARTFTGAVTHKGSTTAKVVEREHLDLEAYVAQLKKAVSEAGWPTDHVQGMAEHLGAVADNHELGTIMEKRGDVIQCRKI